ncbi:MAG: alpha/beta hydrolase [Paracoccaceae bacterium]
MKILLRLFFLIFLLSTTLLSTRSSAQDSASFDLGLVELGFLVTDEPDAALIKVDLLIQSLQSTPEPDPRTTFDLFRTKADLLLATGQNAGAAQVIIALANHATQFQGILYQDPISLHREAAALFDELDDPRASFAQIQAILELQRDGGRSGDVLANTLTLLADRAEQLGRTDDAQNYRLAAIHARQPENIGVRGNGEGYREVDVYYATDRARTGDPEPSEFYGYDRGELELGIARVTIPNTHQPGVVEAPSVWRLEFGPSAAKHVVLQSVTPVGKDKFFDLMQSEFATRLEREAFVFIHGYNVRFEKAARRAAQLAYDMNYSGVPVLYSWPSRGSTIGYIPDTAVVRLSGRRLSRFLDDLVEKSGAETIHIIAHSMGNRALTDALELMALRHGLDENSEPIFDQILFAAPDVDAGLFVKMIETIRPIARRLTLYASSEDWALQSSRKLHGNAPRAGQGGQDTLVNGSIDSIDMSELGEDMLAHSYFAQDSSALADMMSLFWQNAAPQSRCGLVPSQDNTTATRFWKYERGQCASKNLIDVLVHMKRANVTTAPQARSLLAKTTENKNVLAEIQPVILKILAN